MSQMRASATAHMPVCLLLLLGRPPPCVPSFTMARAYSKVVGGRAVRGGMLACVPQQMPSSDASETFASAHVVAAVAACATARLRACAIHVTFSGFTNHVRTASRHRTLHHDSGADCSPERGSQEFASELAKKTAGSWLTSPRIWRHEGSKSPHDGGARRGKSGHDEAVF